MRGGALPCEHPLQVGEGLVPTGQWRGFEDRVVSPGNDPPGEQRQLLPGRSGDRLVDDGVASLGELADQGRLADTPTAPQQEELRAHPPASLQVLEVTLPVDEHAQIIMRLIMSVKIIWAEQAGDEQRCDQSKDGCAGVRMSERREAGAAYVRRSASRSPRARATSAAAVS